MNAPVARGHYEPIDWLWRAGLRFGSAIDLGCADGHFSVLLSEGGPLRGSVILNVDAQDDYRESLAAIEATLGGHFRICAIGARDGGTVALHQGAHSYWSSLRPPGDAYWSALNDLREDAVVQVPLRTVDALVKETGSPGPYLLKMDVQGAEADALAGADSTLADTDVVALEILTEDFDRLHRMLSERGFQLFDLTDLKYTHAGVLGWFYAVYLNVRRSALRPGQWWSEGANVEAIALQHAHREDIRGAIADSLERFKAGRWPPVSA